MPGHLPESRVSDVDVSIGPLQMRFMQDLEPRKVAEPLPPSTISDVLELRSMILNLERRVEALERPWWIKLRDWLKGLL